MRHVYQLAYVSTYNRGRIDSGLQVLRDIIGASTRNNAAYGITGFLIFDGTGFLQILEGDRVAVDERYKVISADPRHRETRVLGARESAVRDFASWSMAGYLRGPAERALFERHGVTGSVVETVTSLEQAVALARSLAAAQQQSQDARG